MKLQTPRLQIVWTDGGETKYGAEFIATYELVLYEGEKAKLDIRADDKDGRPSSQAVKVKFGETKVSGGSSNPVKGDGTLDKPFRDGVHILRDATVLNLPMYIIYKDIVQQIPESDKCHVTDFSNT